MLYRLLPLMLCFAFTIALADEPDVADEVSDSVVVEDAGQVPVLETVEPDPDTDSTNASWCVGDAEISDPVVATVGYTPQRVESGAPPDAITVASEAALHEADRMHAAAPYARRVREAALMTLPVEPEAVVLDGVMQPGRISNGMVRRPDFRPSVPAPGWLTP